MKNGNVKSVSRVFEILERFDQKRRPLNAIEIARALGYPHSSTQALLKTMVNLGYLTYDSQIRAYFPTPKLLIKTKWLADTPMANSSLLEAMEDLQKMTGESITLSSYRNLDMQIVQMTAGSHALTLNLRPGSRLPLFNSAVGIAFLADQSDELMVRLLRRARKVSAATDEPEIPESDVRAAVNQARALGAAVAYGLILEGAGAVAAAIRCPISGVPYVLGVGGPEARISSRESQIVNALREIVDRQA